MSGWVRDYDGRWGSPQKTTQTTSNANLRPNVPSNAGSNAGFGARKPPPLPKKKAATNYMVARSTNSAASIQPSKPPKPAKPVKPPRRSSASSSSPSQSDLGSKGKEFFETTIRRNSQDHGQYPLPVSAPAQAPAPAVVATGPPAAARTGRRPSVGDSVTNWLLPNDRPLSKNGRRSSKTAAPNPILAPNPGAESSKARRFSNASFLGSSSASPPVTLLEASFEGDAGIARANELGEKVEDKYKHLLDNNRVIKEGGVTKYNRSGGSDKPHFIMTATHLLMAELSMVGRNMRFRQAFKLTDVRVSLQPNNKLRIETPIKSFDIGIVKTSECQIWNHEISKAVKEARMAENLPSDYETKLDFSVIWGANTPSCQLCRRDFSVLVRRHHCRNCGKCVCGTCAFSKVRMDQVDENKLQRVCNECAEELKSKRSKGYAGGMGYGAAAAY